FTNIVQSRDPEVRQSKRSVCGSRPGKIEPFKSCALGQSRAIGVDRTRYLKRDLFFNSFSQIQSCRHNSSARFPVKIPASAVITNLALAITNLALLVAANPAKTTEGTCFASAKPPGERRFGKIADCMKRSLSGDCL